MIAPRYVLSPAAQEDVDAIWDYTAGRWGKAQANSYVEDLRAALSRLASGELRARPADDVQPGYRKHQIRSHVVFIRDHPESAFEVVRILHQNMDFAWHLGPR